MLSTGPMTSVQDKGRRGYRSYGVSAAGPMDWPSMALANRLCGNSTEAAALEFAAMGGTFRAERTIRFAVTGADCDIRVGEVPVQPGESHQLDAGETLRIGSLRGAVWGYFAVSGGIATPEVLGSRATHLRFGLGGHEGRALRAGDKLPLGAPEGHGALLRPASPPAAHRLSDPIRIVLGPQDRKFTPEVLDRLSTEEFLITAQRDRMASILDGPDLPAIDGHDIISDGAVPGAIQVPGSSKPMVLMAECQTTGGYPKIATVISADLPRLAQMPTGTRFRFQVVDRPTAEEAARRQASALAALLDSLVGKSTGHLTSEYLLSCDLVGGIYDPEAILMGRAP
ncbi:biotin-dependent carboxyltransferase family protein [Pseudooceanicola lipolyticus]|uniref:5-oxoprolinase subunit C family protein n=1 Tax=Pseudooceanicola lipolyticus TaxID=2029104 RepID=UPI0023E7A15F|nr:biotin-dependent carboxyltransferase family protein [Pseudooceanicola lipolyticus]